MGLLGRIDDYKSPVTFDKMSFIDDFCTFELSNSYITLLTTWIGCVHLFVCLFICLCV